MSIRVAGGLVRVRDGSKVWMLGHLVRLMSGKSTGPYADGWDHCSLLKKFGRQSDYYAEYFEKQRVKQEAQHQIYLKNSTQRSNERRISELSLQVAKLNKELSLMYRNAEKASKGQGDVIGSDESVFGTDPTKAIIETSMNAGMKPHNPGSVDVDLIKNLVAKQSYLQYQLLGFKLVIMKPGSVLLESAVPTNRVLECEVRSLKAVVDDLLSKDRSLQLKKEVELARIKSEHDLLLAIIEAKYPKPPRTEQKLAGTIWNAPSRVLRWIKAQKDNLFVWLGFAWFLYNVPTIQLHGWQRFLEALLVLDPGSIQQAGEILFPPPPASEGLLWRIQKALWVLYPSLPPLPPTSNDSVPPSVSSAPADLPSASQSLSGSTSTGDLPSASQSLSGSTSMGDLPSSSASPSLSASTSTGVVPSPSAPTDPPLPTN